MIPPSTSTLALISLPSLSHHTLVLIELTYERLDHVTGTVPLPLGYPKLLPKIPQTGPSNFWFPNLQLWSRLQKVQSRILQVGGCLPLPDTYPIHIRNPIPQVPCKILDVPQGPIIPLPHTLLRLLLPKFPLCTHTHPISLSLQNFVPPFLLIYWGPSRYLLNDGFLSPKHMNSEVLLAKARSPQQLALSEYFDRRIRQIHHQRLPVPVPTQASR